MRYDIVCYKHLSLLCCPDNPAEIPAEATTLNISGLIPTDSIYLPEIEETLAIVYPRLVTAGALPIVLTAIHGAGLEVISEKEVALTSKVLRVKIFASFYLSAHSTDRPQRRLRSWLV